MVKRLNRLLTSDIYTASICSLPEKRRSNPQLLMRLTGEPEPEPDILVPASQQRKHLLPPALGIACQVP